MSKVKHGKSFSYKQAPSKCPFGVDVCDDEFMCTDCSDARRFDQANGCDPAKQRPGTVCAFCGEGATCEHGYCRVCQVCLQCAEEGQGDER